MNIKQQTPFFLMAAFVAGMLVQGALISIYESNRSRIIGLKITEPLTAVVKFPQLESEIAP